MTCLILASAIAPWIRAAGILLCSLPCAQECCFLLFSSITSTQGHNILLSGLPSTQGHAFLLFSLPSTQGHAFLLSIIPNGQEKPQPNKSLQFRAFLDKLASGMVYVIIW